MQLLEREAQLGHLAALATRAAQGQGGCALVLGEAGIGKTALVRSFCAVLPPSAALLRGACEPLFTPRPLGPMIDLADELPPGLARRLHEGQRREGLFSDLLDHLRGRGRPTVLVIEDVHWADEATLDWITYAGRRLQPTSVLLVLSARDDELAADPTLRRRLDELPVDSTHRIPIAPLTLAAVAVLAQARGRDAAQLAQQTGGNPFYLTELLAAEGPAVPGSIRDAILGRVARLSPAARRIVECAAVEPGRLEQAAVDACEPDAAPAMREAVACGLLETDGHALSFRHEIARRSVESALAPARRSELHVRVLRWLQATTRENDHLTRRVHHAQAAGLAQEVACLAPRAAEQAARLGAHRESAALYRLALGADVRREDAEQAALLEAAARELQVTSALDEAIELRSQALALHRSLGNAERVGVNLRLIGVLHQQADADIAMYLRHAQAAAQALVPLGASAELAKAYATLSHAYCLNCEYDAAIDWGRRAVELAERVDDPAARALALNRLGSARVCRVDDADGRAQVERALALAIDHGFEGLAADIYVCLQTLALNHHDHAAALEVGARGIAYCQARDMDGYIGSLRSRCAFSLMHLGRWDEAEREYQAVLTGTGVAAPSRNSAHYALQRLAVRRGSTSADDYWRLAQTRMEDLAVGYRLPAIAAACAEAAWLRGDPVDAVDLARRGLCEAQRADDGRLAGPLLVWLRRLGAPVTSDTGTLLPACALELAGDVAAAACEWRRLHNPYEEALALLSGDSDQVRAARALFARLGALRLVQKADDRLHASGAGRGVATRERRAAARELPHGLTPRERDVLDLLLDGLSNDAIAARLQRSERTIEQHVSSVLAKVGVRSRRELIARAARDAAATP